MDRRVENVVLGVLIQEHISATINDDEHVTQFDLYMQLEKAKTEQKKSSFLKEDISW